MGKATQYNKYVQLHEFDKHQNNEETNKLSENLDGRQILPHIFRLHLNPKKQHEVIRLAHLSSLAAASTGAKVLVDVGSGQGHLSRLISYGYSVPTICLDGEKDFIQGAQKFDQQLEKFSRKRQRKGVNLPEGPRHSTVLIDPSKDQQAFCEMVNTSWPELRQSQEDMKFGFIGLHTCGNLAPLMIKQYVKTPSAETLISVGCCYMKMTTEIQQYEFVGYPLSSFIGQMENNTLSYTALEMACHAIDTYSERLKENSDNLKVHCYRAVMEKVLIKKNPLLRHAGLASVKNAHLMAFHRYARKTCAKLEITFEDDELSSCEIDEDLSHWPDVVKFYTLRLMLAPAVETLVLLDRLLYLYEQGIPSILFPLFDPSLSPRNHVILSIKRS